ncbi:MAG: CpsD/CapB family tyrosine-protein kinase [Clostridia bacterium]|nr:CpsD/CapB family tyrosine-protein kinase [Clostridia bacterium]
MQNEIITFTSPKASVSEVFRTLRTNIQFMTANNEHNSILFTSTQAGDGKSWIAANLAITFAQAGKKVIIVDTDMRRGRQHNIFELANNRGLSNFLILSTKEAKDTLADYIQPTPVENLFVITAGVVPPNPSELLTSTKMIDLIKTLEGMADIVIFDSTPSTMVTDAMAISRYVGSTIIVASHKKTKMEVLKQIKRNIENVGGKVSGVILNKVPMNKREYGKSYYYESSIVTSTVKEKKPKIKNTDGEGKASKLFGNIFGGNSNKVEDNKVEKMKEKLDKVEEEKTIESTNVVSKEDEDLNNLLKKLTNYLENK